MKRVPALVVLMLVCSTPLLLLLVPAARSAAPDDNSVGMANNAPQYTPEGKLIKPTNYREWTFLTSGFGMNYSTGASTSPMFTNVFVNPESHKAFLATGHWPDKTTWVIEIYSPATHGSINKNGQYQDAMMGLDIEVKDSSKPEGWQYYFAGIDDKAVEQSQGASGCLNCHSKNGAVENTFVQFYPTLLDLAVKKQTLNASYHPPLNSTRFYDLIVNEGWQKAESALAADRKANPNSEFLTRHTLAGDAARLVNHGRKEEGIQLFQLLTREYPSSAQAWGNLADAYHDAGNKPGEIDALTKGLQVLPNDPAVNAEDKKMYTKEANERLAKLKQ